MSDDLKTIISALGHVGLDYRGGFHPGNEDGVPDCTFGPSDGNTAIPDRPGTLILAGNIGGSMWSAFQAGRRREPHALDKWTKRVMTDVIRKLEPSLGDVVACYPSDGPPYLPFQRWAMRGDQVYPSPIGPLIHPVHGLWHAYRGALMFRRKINLPPPEAKSNPCNDCSDKPCLSGCPVQAIGQGFYDVKGCAAHLMKPSGEPCLEFGCLARSACPVGPGRPYPEAQTRFHMGIFRDTYGSP